MFPEGRLVDVTGPWQPTIELAINAFVGMIKSQKMTGVDVYHQRIAQECVEDTANWHDGDRYYNVLNSEFANSNILATALYKAGLRVG